MLHLVVVGDLHLVDKVHNNSLKGVEQEVQEDFLQGGELLDRLLEEARVKSEERTLGPPVQPRRKDNHL